MNIQDLIRQSRLAPPKPIVTDLLNEDEIAGLHGAPEVFKTVFVLQFAESLATGKPFLGVWQVPKPRIVYFFETEMSPSALGKRLTKMYVNQAIPSGIHFADEKQLKQFRRAANLQCKFDLLNGWVREAGADVLILDTANPCFRGAERPNEETAVGAFFDLLAAVPASTKLFVRHNRKSREDDAEGDPAMKIRGSGQFVDVPDLLVELSRPDKRTNEAVLGVSKYRHGAKPDDLPLWLDAGGLRLVSIPPVIHLLLDGPRSRPELLEGLEKRFGVKQSKGDALIKAEGVYLKECFKGHTRVCEIDWEAAPMAPWYCRIGDGERGVGSTEEDTQPCVSPPVSPRVFSVPDPKPTVFSELLTQLGPLEVEPINWEAPEMRARRN